MRWQSIRTVSYTHLDVYKRQAHYSGKRMADGLKQKLWYMAGFVPGTFLYLVWNYKFGKKAEQKT